MGAGLAFGCAGMADFGFWTAERLIQIEADISAFERVAFESADMKLLERIKRMKFAARAICDENVRDILGRSVDYIAKHPEFVRRAIALARGHVLALRK